MCECYNLLHRSLHHINDKRNYEPFPEVRPVKHKQHPKRHIQQMRPVENFEATATPHERLRAQKHYDEHAKQCDPRWIRTATAQSKLSRPRRQQPFGQRKIVVVRYRIVHNNHRKIDHVHDGVHHTVDGNQNAGHFVHVNVIVQRQHSAKATRSQKCYALAQHQHKYKCTIEIQTLT